MTTTGHRFRLASAEEALVRAALTDRSPEGAGTARAAPGVCIPSGRLVDPAIGIAALKENANEGPWFSRFRGHGVLIGPLGRDFLAKLPG